MTWDFHWIWTSFEIYEHWTHVKVSGLIPASIGLLMTPESKLGHLLVCHRDPVTARWPCYVYSLLPNHMTWPSFCLPYQDGPLFGLYGLSLWLMTAIVCIYWLKTDWSNPLQGCDAVGSHNMQDWLPQRGVAKCPLFQVFFLCRSTWTVVAPS